MIQSQDEFNKMKKTLAKKDFALIVYRKGQFDVIDTLDIPIIKNGSKTTIGEALQMVMDSNTTLAARVTVLEKKVQALIDLQKGE